MSERKNIASWTAPSGAWPPYISVNKSTDGVEITVRAHPKNMGEWIECGDTASIVLSSADFHRLVDALRGSPNKLTEADL